MDSAHAICNPPFWLPSLDIVLQSQPHHFAGHLDRQDPKNAICLVDSSTLIFSRPFFFCHCLLWQHLDHYSWGGAENAAENAHMYINQSSVFWKRQRKLKVFVSWKVKSTYQVSMRALLEWKVIFDVFLLLPEWMRLFVNVSWVWKMNFMWGQGWHFIDFMLLQPYFTAISPNWHEILQSSVINFLPQRNHNNKIVGCVIV